MKFFRTRLAALELEMVYTCWRSDAAKLEELERAHDDMLAQADEYAYARACELVGPNSPEFEHLREQLYEELVS